MEKRIKEAVCRYGMEEIFSGAILGFSGGADSGALLHYLKDRCAHLVAVHVNHMIRGEEADRDEAFCRSVCEKYGVELLVYRVDVPTLSAERKKGLEETAREERYRIFREILGKNPQCKCIVTAHNSNDNAETVVFNLARGSGANGICGIKPVHENVYRPLIFSTRNDIIKYCKDNNIEYVTDSTNSDIDYTRNRIRHTVLPQLMEINPCFLESCTRLGEILRRDEEYIGAQADNIIKAVKNGKIPKKDAVSSAPSVLARVLKAVSGTALDYDDVNACLGLINRWHTGKMVNLSGGITFKVERDYCFFIPTDSTKENEFFVELAEGINKINDTGVAICVNCAFEGAGYYRLGSVRLNPSAIKGKLYARSKQDGDCVKSLGITKKLKRIFSDMHIPSHQRSRIPVICDELGVVGIPGIVARDGAFDKKGELLIEIYTKEKIGGINEKEK